MEISLHIVVFLINKCKTHWDNHNICPEVNPYNFPCPFLFIFICLYVILKGSSRAHMEAVERIPCQILLPPVPADCWICLGLAGGPLLDITVSHRQCHVTLSSGVILLLEDLVKKWTKVSMFILEMVGATGPGRGILTLRFRNTHLSSK